MEEQDVYCVQFVNLKIFTFVSQAEKKLPIYFPLFPSMINSIIFSNGLNSLWRLVSEKLIEFGTLSWLLHVFHFVNTLKTLCVLANYSNLRVLGIMDHLRSTGLPGVKQMTKPKKIYLPNSQLSSYNYAFPSGK